MASETDILAADYRVILEIEWLLVEETVTVEARYTLLVSARTGYIIDYL